MARRPLLAPVAGSILGLGLALSGCASSADTTTLAAAGSGSLGTAVSPDRALAALPPEAGAVVSVIERRTADGEVRQTITLAGDARSHGDDRIEVTARPKGTGAAPRLDADTLAAEMADALPGVDMTVSPRVIASANGPLVGVATGTGADGAACLYAWSTGEARRASAGERLFGLSFDAGPDTSVRVRLCRRGTSPDRLIAFAEGLRLRSDLASASAGRLAPAAGTDALAAAGYGTTAPAPAAASLAPVPSLAATPSNRPAATARHVAPAKSVPAVEASARSISRREPAPAASSTAPIPLPAGG